MKIVKGDTVYLRTGKDVSNTPSRLRQALGLKEEARFKEAREQMAMAEQIETANKSAGVRGKVLRVMPKEGKIVVEGLNKVTKHQKPRATSGTGALQQGGRIQIEASIPISRVMLVCPNCDKPTRVGMRVHSETRPTLTGTKTVQVRERFCKQCNEKIGRPTER